MGIRKIKTIFFDLGNVLIFFDFGKMMDQLCVCTGLEKKEIVQMIEVFRESYDTGKMTSLEVFNLFKRASSRSFTSEEFFRAVSDIFEPNQPMFPIVEHLKKNHRLVLLSNTSHAHFEHIKLHYPILKFFDEYILSYEVGAAKPDSKIFHTALKAANCSPQECFYTDDIPEYVAAGRMHGIDAEVFTNEIAFRNHLSARGLI